ncbi:T9SS type A sorting domain-containing protein [Pontibacter cellulosilyticus]|uniref:T9SS type A sorting domain-containing protein n=1 Tax=Pontibacter cellulosilyticus TaxID=1720253 RepID=A0A923N9W5_9BACT|nr:T9SS type A sorting domain-containing protein [Pontibacter cellulosilyticus]MBC5993572.1 T9SS type A sorting domain-containing protein [Pontibacter cellulosilyticus]
MIKHLQKTAALALLGFALLAGNEASAQINLTSLTYTQNFDGMGTTTPTTFPNGWTAVRYAGTGELGAVLTPVITDGSANSGAIYNVGTTDATDRAFGSISSNSTSVRFGAGFTNGTTSTIGTVQFAATMEQWRSGSSATADEISAFEYSFNATGINDANATWTALTSMDLVEKLKTVTDNTAVNGNDAANKTSISGTISGITLAPGSNLWIRWSDPNDGGSDGLYAIDDFTLTLTAATTTGIADATKGMFSIYPNPMQSQNVRLSLPGHIGSQKVSLTVWSVEGKELFKATGSQAQVQESLNSKMASLSKGMFFVNVTAGKEVYQTKLLKN